MLSDGGVELNNVHFLFLIDNFLRSTNGKDGATMVPFDARYWHASVDEDRVFVHFMLHDLRSAIVETESQAGAAGLDVSVWAIVPIEKLIKTKAIIIIDLLVLLKVQYTLIIR